ncbi:hypothetical protein HN51_067286 [Arachis hypogaea]
MYCVGFGCGILVLFSFLGLDFSEMCLGLFVCRAVIRGRNIKLAVVIIHTGAGTYIREGRSRDSILSCNFT